MINGYCRTNLDGYEREEWPEAFAAVPRKGERVAAKSGRNLAVVSVTHKMRFEESWRGSNDIGPYIEIELHR